MSAEAITGTWIFDHNASNLKSPPAEWRQVIQVNGNGVSVREEITRESGSSLVEVAGAFDGEFYQVKGSPLVEEIAYTFESGCIRGTGRKQGSVVLREIVGLLDANTLHVAMAIFMSGKEVPLGNAVFRRV